MPLGESALSTVPSSCYNYIEYQDSDELLLSMTSESKKKKRLSNADYCVDTEIWDQIDYGPTWQERRESAFQVGSENVRHG